ncbi:hypothetical protein CFP56_019175 [Quercus suber]|uniref:Uncharacterized protein n=1 Tax=Quercus suber TaxID=58331 RepID=A0AAW0M1P7_QUESU
MRSDRDEINGAKLRSLGFSVWIGDLRCEVAISGFLGVERRSPVRRLRSLSGGTAFPRRGEVLLELLEAVWMSKTCRRGSTLVEVVTGEEIGDDDSVNIILFTVRLTRKERKEETIAAELLSDRTLADYSWVLADALASSASRSSTYSSSSVNLPETFSQFCPFGGRN